MRARCSRSTNSRAASSATGAGPAGLQTALEWKEGVPRKVQGRVLGSITVENLVALYPTVCGMTGTAATQARDFREMYDLEVEVIPTHRPVIRIDHPDAVFATKSREGSGRHRGDPRDSCDRAAGAGGHGERPGIRIDQPSARRHPALRAERAE